MLRSLATPLAFAVALTLVAAPAARAAGQLDLGSEVGVMVSQAAHTLGGSFVDCGGLLGGRVPDTAQVACAELPADMFGYFEMGVHGRLYEYLERGTLRVADAWHSAGDLLEVSYDLHGGTLTVERERVGGRLYAVFEFTGSARYASADSGGNEGPAGAAADRGGARGSAPGQGGADAARSP